jgi:hypothetical protein
MFLDEKEFCKEGFVLKIVSNRRDKDNPSNSLVLLQDIRPSPLGL